MATPEVRTRPAPRTGPWRVTHSHDEDGRPLTVRVIGDDAGPGRHAVLDQPRIRRLPDGGRVLSVTLVLSRPPTVDEVLTDLVQQAVLGFEVDIVPPEAACAALRAATGAVHTPLFPRRTTVRLTDDAAGVLLAETSVTMGVAAVSATLDRPAALALLAAVRGRPGALTLRVEAQYRAADGESPPGPAAVHPSPGPRRMAVVRLSAPLHRLIGAAIPAGASDRYLAVVTVGGDRLGWEPLPRLVRTGARPAPAALLVTDGRVTTAWNAVRPAVVGRPSAHAILAAGRPDLVAGRLDRWAVNDLAVELTPTAPPNGPVVAGGSGPWADRFEAGRYWYPPAVSLVLPDPADPVPADGPFRFAFRTVGHDRNGRPSLQASVRLTVAWGVAPETTEQWERLGRPAMSALPVENVSVELLVPFRDEQGAARVQAIRATTVQAGTAGMVATVDLTDEWARVAYGALAVPGFQAVPAQVSVAYTFGGWDQLPAVALHGATMLAATLAPLQQWRARPPAHLAALSVIRPEVTIRPEVLAATEQVQYGWRTHGRTQNVETLLPCARYGVGYVEESAAGVQAVGCRDAYHLGQAPNRGYERVEVAAAAAGTRVLRSLISPGRFVIVPGAYRIGRYGATESARAFRPTITLYSTIDAEHPTNVQCVLSAGLQADLPPEQRYRIEQELRSRYHPVPVVEMITELPATVTFGWALPQSTGGWSVQLDAVRSWDGFQVTATTNAAGILALQAILARSGVQGAATLTLTDGTPLDVKLALELGAIVGPWDTGPVTARLTGPEVTLHNNVEAPVSVTDMIVIGATGDATVPVEAVLGPGGQHKVAVPDQTTAVLPVTWVQPGAASLTEVRAYVEDIAAEVIFVNLVDLAAHGLTAIEVTARIRGLDGEQRLTLERSGAAARVTFVLALTTFATDPVLEFRVARAGGTAAGAGEWTAWQLSSQGHVVSLTWDLVTAHSGI